jgi:hypothetical protein
LPWNSQQQALNLLAWAKSPAIVAIVSSISFVSKPQSGHSSETECGRLTLDAVLDAG